MKLLAPISLEIPQDALALDVGAVLEQLRGVLLPEGWRLKVGVVSIEHASKRIVVNKKPR